MEDLDVLGVGVVELERVDEIVVFGFDDMERVVFVRECRSSWV